MRYADQLKDPRWIDKSNRIKEQRGECQLCTTKKFLQVHHPFYAPSKMAWDYADSDLWCLCDHCHKTWGAVWRCFERWSANAGPRTVFALLHALTMDDAEADWVRETSGEVETHVITLGEFQRKMATQIKLNVLTDRES